MLTTLKNNPKNNHFAPEWRIDYYESVLDAAIVSEMERLILLREPAILKHVANLPSLKTQGHKNNSMTGKFMYYNIFAWPDECFVEFKEFVSNSHKNFVTQLGLDVPKIYGKCWANVLRKDEYIPLHNHASPYDADGYISGFLTVKADNTYTHLGHPWLDNEIAKFPNTPGNLTLFPSYTMHWADSNESDTDVRITVAFDLFTMYNDRYPTSPVVKL